MRRGVEVLVAAVTLASLIRMVRQRGKGSFHARLWLMAILWIVLAQLPFGVTEVTPSTGRYWYLASAGLGLLAAAVVGALAAQPWRRGATVAFALAVGLSYLPPLLRYVDAHVEASLEARKSTLR